MNAYTSLEQSKKLAEILPIESADMYYKYVLPKSDKIHHIPEIGNPINSLKWYNEGYTFGGRKEPITLNEYCIPCWSIAALMNVFPKEEGSCTSISFVYYDVEGNYINSWLCCYEKEGESTDDYIIETIPADNPVDCCYEMILKLHEQKLL